MKVKNVLLGTLIALSVSNVANATIYRWSFTTTGSNGIFAFLDFDSSTSDFRIFDNGSNDYLTNVIGINGVSFDFNGSPTINVSADTFDEVGVNANTVLSPTTNPVPLGNFTSSFATQSNAAAFEVGSGGSFSFNFGALTISDLDQVAIRLNTVNGNLNQSDNTNSFWIVGSPVAQVPEPETYAMFMAGLGLLGFVSRRKKSV